MLDMVLIPTCSLVGGTSGKELICQCRDRDIRSLIPGQEDPLEEALASYSSILGGRIPWTEELGGLQSVGLQKVGHD